MGYTEWIAKYLAPPGMHSTNWGRLYRLLGNLADGYAGDHRWLLRQHFALSCEPQYARRLGRMYGLPRWSFEGDDSYRERLATAGFELEGRGSTAQFHWFMDGLFGANIETTVNWVSNGESPAVFAVGRTAVGMACVGGINTLRIGIAAVGAFTVGESLVAGAVVGGLADTAAQKELGEFLGWFLAPDIAYEIYYL